MGDYHRTENSHNDNRSFKNSGNNVDFQGAQINSDIEQAAPPPASDSEKSSASRKSDAKAATRQFDVCIVCALGEEAREVLNEFGARGEGVTFKRSFSKMTGYEYRHTTIKNCEGEELKVLVMSLPATGGIETANGVRSLIAEFQPRFVAMTGICAGYKAKVSLGDLVAAPYAFSMQEGKVEVDPQGEETFRPEWLTHKTASRIIQYVQSFDDWLEPISEMKQQFLGRELQPGEEPRRLIFPVASSMSVHANAPFPRLMEHNRKAVFLDQEVAAFYQTLGEFPDVYFLAVKGVCDYGDSTKNDDYHSYAARASATYLLYFIQNYVTEESMGRESN